MYIFKETDPLIGQNLLSGVWPPIDRWCLVWAVTESEGMEVMEHGGDAGDGAMHGDGGDDEANITGEAGAGYSV